ncbi:MAG: rhomboid family intramembrane serine protease [Bacteroidetes bacterium]|nr:MAG: rhomboid family intramembrane serine protease [Bacteroidota bacterium]
MSSEKNKLFYSLFFPGLFLLVIWIVGLAEYFLDVRFVEYGLYPRSWEGAVGILTSPLIHADFNHLFANSVPLFVLGASLFYFYRSIALRVFLLIWLFSNIWVWGIGREAFHIGASGLVYGLAAFLFVSGLIRKEPRLMAISMFVAFLYGSLIWGIFPDLFPEKNISWEGHLMGMLAGVIFAIYFRKQGPQKRRYSWEIEGEDDEDVEGPAYWKVTPGPDFKP